MTAGTQLPNKGTGALFLSSTPRSSSMLVLANWANASKVIDSDGILHGSSRPLRPPYAWGKANLVSTTVQQTPIFGTTGCVGAFWVQPFLRYWLQNYYQCGGPKGSRARTGETTISPQWSAWVLPIGLDLATGPCPRGRLSPGGVTPNVAERGDMQVAIAGLGDVQDVEPGVATGTQDDHFPGLAPGVARVGLLDGSSRQRLADCQSATGTPGYPFARKLRRRCW